MLTKEDFVNKVLDLLANDSYWDYESAMTLWWQDNRNDSGMRLTNTGHTAFQAAGLENWEFDIPAGTPVRPVQLLMLNRHLVWPYHISVGKHPCIAFYGGREATMFALYQDIDKFVRALKDFG